MRLISLTSSKESFRALHFRPKGLSLILAKQKTPGSGDDTRTYNGVGKSLAIALIHFCLGSSKNRGFEKAIPEWEFELKFMIGNQQYISRRNTSTQGTISLNDEQLSLSKFRNVLEGMLFSIPASTKYLKFRPLIQRFIRPKKESYVSFDMANSQESAFQKLLVNGFLLGLDTELISKKHDLKLSRDQITAFKNNLSKDTVFSEYFTGNKDVEIELKDLEEKISSLAHDLEHYRVAENYYEVQKEADDLKRNIEALKNKLVIIENAIRQIDISLNMRADISFEKLRKVYEETKSVWTDSVVKKIEDITDFHNRLLKNRESRLKIERMRLRKNWETIQSEIRPQQAKFDEFLTFLGTHGALDEFVSMTSILGDLKAKAQKIRDYKGLLAKYSEDIQEINLLLVDQIKKANEYLEASANMVNGNLERFRLFSKRFYPDRSGGITVHNNIADNQLRFDINVRLQDDRSDGINEVKIFCYDMTILTSHHGHDVNFLFHDSRLYGDIDHRKRASLFKVAHECSNKDNFQYIATVNEDQISSIREQFNDEEFEKIISENVIMELTDESPAGKLLGIQIELQY